MENPITDSTKASRDYADYYLHAIAQQRNSESNGGLKLVVGPTGLGKTSAIPNVISQIRAQRLEKGFIYTSHRHLLIAEMQEMLCKQKIPCVYLKKDEDVVREFLRNPEKSIFLNHLETLNFFTYAKTSRKSLEQIIQGIQIMDDVLRKLKTIKGGGIYSEPKEEFSKKCSEFLLVFKNGLSNGDLPEKTKQQLVNHPQIWKLFPYMAFKYDVNKPVLLVTIHKLLYGFFDGEKIERVLALENNVIFIDEFDMQEKEMLSFLCSSPEIQNSFEFVRLFYEEMTRQKKLGYLSVNPDDSENVVNAKEMGSKILDQLDTDCNKEKLNFPQIRHFVLKDSEFPKKSLAIFQSGVRILTTPFYLLDKATHWEIVKKRSSNTLRARSLIDIISRTTDSILNFFSEIYADGLYPQWNNWVEQCYDQKNDNFPGRYKKIISEYGFYRRPARLSKERRGKEITNSVYFQGFNFFRLVSGVYGTSPEEVRIERIKD